MPYKSNIKHKKQKTKKTYDGEAVKSVFTSIVDNDSTTPVVGEIYEEVVHPPHYNQLPNGIECWDVNEHFPTNVGNAIKYLWRAGIKPGQETVKDLEKAIQYTKRQISLIEGNNPRMR